MTVYEPYENSEDSPIHLVASHRGEIDDPLHLFGIAVCAISLAVLCWTVLA